MERIDVMDHPLQSSRSFSSIIYNSCKYTQWKHHYQTTLLFHVSRSSRIHLLSHSPLYSTLYAPFHHISDHILFSLHCTCIIRLTWANGRRRIDSNRAPTAIPSGRKRSGLRFDSIPTTWSLRDSQRLWYRQWIASLIIRRIQEFQSHGVCAWNWHCYDYWIHALLFVSLKRFVFVRNRFTKTISYRYPRFSCLKFLPCERSWAPYRSAANQRATPVRRVFLQAGSCRWTWKGRGR